MYLKATGLELRDPGHEWGNRGLKSHRALGGEPGLDPRLQTHCLLPFSWSHPVWLTLPAVLFFPQCWNTWRQKSLSFGNKEPQSSMSDQLSPPQTLSSVPRDVSSRPLRELEINSPHPMFTNLLLINWCSEPIANLIICNRPNSSYSGKCAVFPVWDSFILSKNPNFSGTFWTWETSLWPSVLSEPWPLNGLRWDDKRWLRPCPRKPLSVRW